MADACTVETLIERFAGLEARSTGDALAVEAPLEIRLGYGPKNVRRVKSVSVTMRTPGRDCDLAAGFLMTEGVIRDPNDIDRIEHVVERPLAGPAPLETTERAGRGPGFRAINSTSSVVCVQLRTDVEVNMASLERNFYVTSSCGVCGKASLSALHAVGPPRARNTFEVEAHILYSLPPVLRRAQGAFDRTGGLHAAGLFSQKGELRSIREDVGRHNAVDKLLGSEFLSDRTPLRDRILLLSGRASFELLQKAVMAGIPMVVSVGAPSSLAVEVAREFDITLIGFLREESFNVYHGARRLTGYAHTETETLL